MGVLSVPINEEIMSCTTWSAVLEHATRRGEQMDEVNVVTSLHRAAKLYREEDGGNTPLEIVHRHEGLHCLLELVWHFAIKCRPQQLANSVWACAVLMCHNTLLLQKLCGFAVLRLSGYTPQNVANTIWALATVGYQHEQLFDLIAVYVEANVRDFSPQDLANTCWAFAKLQRSCDRVFQCIIGESLIRLPSFQAQNMSNLVWSCATIMFKDDSSIQFISNHAAARVQEFSTQELSNLTWGTATLNVLSQDWLESSGAEMAKRSRDCCPQDLSNTIWAYGTLQHKINEHMRAINWEVMRQIEDFSPQGLSNVAWGLSAIEYRDIKALTCISEEVIRRPLDQFSPPDISTLLYSFAVIAWLHEGALAKLRRAVRYSTPVMATRDVANVSWALVTLSHRDDDIFRKLTHLAVDMMTDFSVQGLCNIAWAFVRFGIEIPEATARGIAEETVKRRCELLEEPGDAVLLSDAVCSEWEAYVPRHIFNECDEIGREQYNKVFAFMADMSNIPDLGASQADVERYQSFVSGLGIIQLGRRLTVEFLKRLNMLEERPDITACLRPLREQWLWEELKHVEPTDASLQHKTTGAWVLCHPGRDTISNTNAQIVASGTPMGAEMRFIPCVVEHSRASDAEFQVVNRAADYMISKNLTNSESTLHLDVSEIPCLSCLGALRQFQKAFPKTKLCLGFSIRKVSEVCVDLSNDPAAQYDGVLAGSCSNGLGTSLPNNRGKSSGLPVLPTKRLGAQVIRMPLTLKETREPQMCENIENSVQREPNVHLSNRGAEWFRKPDSHLQSEQIASPIEDEFVPSACEPGRLVVETSMTPSSCRQSFY